jgi:hypothetical protein
MQIWKAMRATTIAPRYMPPTSGVTQSRVIEPGLVDYGRAKDNPTRDLFYECRKLFRHHNGKMILVSIGTGLGLNRDKEIMEMADSVENRQKEARASGQKFEQEFSDFMERQWIKYFRFNVTGLEDVPLEEWAHEDLIKQKTSAYLARPEVGNIFYACVDTITALLLEPHGG